MKIGEKVSMAAVLLGGCGVLCAGEIEGMEEMVLPEEKTGWSFCDALNDLRTPLYSNPSNPIIQELKLTARFHYQAGFADGESNGADFSGQGGELRRLWGGVRLKLFNDIDVLATGRFNDGGFRNDDLGYRETDFIQIAYSLGDVGPLENAKLGYGRYRLDFGREWHIGNNTIKTVERSPIFNQFTEPRATGARFTATVGGVDLIASVTNTGRAPGWSSWDGGEAYHLATSWDALGGRFFADGYFIDADPDVDELFGFDKAFSLAYEWKMQDWTLMVNGLWGDVGSDDVWAGIAMAHRMIYQDKVEAVLRYQYGKASGDILPVGGRTAVNVARFEGEPAGRGDTAQNLYAGINLYGCGKSKANSMLLLGIEWDRLTGSVTDFESTTFWANYRIWF